MFLAFLRFSASNIYSVDFGSMNVRIGKQTPGKQVEIVMNKHSQRFTPNYLAFISNSSEEVNLTGIEWVVGVDAERVIRKNPEHGVQNPFYYLNNPKDFPLGKFVTPVEASSIALATYLKSYKRKNDKVIVSVPSVFSPQARRNLMNSLKLIGITSAQLINSNSALATLYAIEKLPITDNCTRTVLFVDIGAIQTEISKWRFDRRNQSITITLEDYRFSDEIGGYLIDDLLMNFTLKKLPREPTKYEMPIIKRAVIKAKERLAAGMTFIDLSEDFSLRIPLYQENVSDLAHNIIEKLDKLIENITADEVELVGGSTRLPCFIQSITKAFGEKPHRSMNSDEAVALGSAYFAALQSGMINGALLHIVKPSLFGIAFDFNGKETNVFAPGDKIERKTVRLRKFSDFNFTLKQTRDSTKFPYVHTDLIPSENKTYSRIEVYDLTNFTRSITKKIAKGDKPYLSLMFDVSQQLDCLDFISASLNANVTVNITIQNETINQVSPTSWQLKYNTIINEAEIDFPKSKELLDGIRGYRRRIAQQRKSHNALLDFIIDTNEKLQYSNDMKAVSTPEERSQLQQMLARERQSVDLAGFRVSAAELDKRLATIKERMSGLLERFEEYSLRPRAIADLNKTIARATKELATAITDNETIAEFVEFLNETKQLIQDALEMDPLSQPTITVKKLNTRRSNLLKKIPNLRSPPRKKKPAVQKDDESASLGILMVNTNTTEANESVPLTETNQTQPIPSEDNSTNAKIENEHNEL